MPSMCESCSISMKKLILHLVCAVRIYLRFSFLFASLIAAWCLCWRGQGFIFCSALCFPHRFIYFFGADFIHSCSDFCFLLSVQASRPSGLPLGSPSGCGEQALRSSTRFSIWMRGAGSRLLIFHSLQTGAHRAGTASDLFTRCCCFHILAAFSLILCLLVPSNLAHMSAAHVGLKFLLISFFRLASSVFSQRKFFCVSRSVAPGFLFFFSS
jgi:hypothetical protein